MNTLYESILSGKRASIEQGISVAKLAVLHDHSQGIGKAIELIDDGDNAVKIKDGSLYFQDQVDITQPINIRKPLGIQNIVAPRLMLYKLGDKVFDVEENLGHIFCQELYLNKLANGLKNLYVTFRGSGVKCIVPNKWEYSGLVTRMQAAGTLRIEGSFVKTNEKLLLENCVFENKELMSNRFIEFIDCCPEFRNVKMDKYNTMIIRFYSNQIEEKYAIGQALMSLLDRDYTFECLHKLKKIQRNCKSLRNIFAYFNNINKYTSIEAPYKVRPDAKISDIWDLKDTLINTIIIEDSKIKVSIFKKLGEAKVATNYTLPSNIESHFKTADGWYIIINRLR